MEVLGRSKRAEGMPGKPAGLNSRISNTNGSRRGLGYRASTAASKTLLLNTCLHAEPQEDFASAIYTFCCVRWNLTPSPHEEGAWTSERSGY